MVALAHSLHDSGVDVAKLLKAEQASAVGRVVEDIALEEAPKSSAVALKVITTCIFSNCTHGIGRHTEVA